MGSAAVAHRLSRSSASVVFLDWGLNPRPQHRKMGSYPLDHQGSPRPFKIFNGIFHFSFQQLLFRILSFYYLYNAAKQLRRRQWHPTPVLLPGKSHGRRCLVGCNPWGCKELDVTERLHFHALEKEMATHSSVLAWRIPGMGEPGGLLSMGSHRVRHV